MNNSEKHISQARLSESFKGNVLTKITQNVSFRFSFLCSRIYSTGKITLEKKKEDTDFLLEKYSALQFEVSCFCTSKEEKKNLM